MPSIKVKKRQRFFKNTLSFFIIFIPFSVRRIQQENVNKKQTVLKLISILRENPEILDKAEKAGNPEPGFSCIQAAQSTPG